MQCCNSEHLCYKKTKIYKGKLKCLYQSHFDNNFKCQVCQKMQKTFPIHKNRDCFRKNYIHVTNIQKLTIVIE